MNYKDLKPGDSVTDNKGDVWTCVRSRISSDPVTRPLWITWLKHSTGELVNIDFKLGTQIPRSSEVFKAGR